MHAARRHLLSRIAAVAVGGIALACVSHAAAQNAKTELLQRNLNGPIGIAIRPGGPADDFEVYFTERGVARVSKINVKEPANPIEVIRRPDEPGPVSQFPGSLLYLSPDRLVVGYVDRNGRGSLRNFEFAATQPLPMTADQSQQSLELGERPAGEPSEGARFPIALTRTQANDRVPDVILGITPSPAEAWKIPIRAGTLDNAAPFFKLNSAAGPACAATSGQGYLVVAQAAENGAETLLAFHNPIDGAQVMERMIGLQSVHGLAYSPRTGNLYAAAYGPDSSDELPKQRGIFRIDEVGPGQPCRAVQVAEVLRPTGLAFGPDGVLYVIAAGRMESGSPDAGLLVKVTGEL